MNRMLRNKSFLLLAVVLGTASSLDAQDPDTKKKEIEELLAKVKKSDAAVDFTRLRTIASEFDSYVLDADSTSSSKMFAALRAGDEKGALEIAEKRLAQNYLDVDAQFVSMVASDKLGDRPGATHHRYVWKGIIDSILASGDGKTPKTAFKVIAVNEEYTLLHALGLEVQQQSLSHIDEHSFDVLTVLDPKSKEQHEVYFNIDPIWAAETRLFSK
jgi:uncharacterized protein DUF4919